LADLLARATRHRWSPTQLLEELVRAESQERAQRSLERRLARARLGTFKPMADFDWAWPKSVDRAAVERVLTLGFLERAENVILVAAQGLGKTMIAKNVAHQAVLQGASVRCVTAADLLLDLGGQETSRALERRLRAYVKPRLVVIDELGYLAYDNRAADLLFQIISRRYERGSLLVTTNLAFKDWGTVFPNAACVTALIDRLTHHAEILTLTGESYRRREAEAAQKARRGKA
jgi:DNA replication protein DnaC